MASSYTLLKGFGGGCLILGLFFHNYMFYSSMMMKNYNCSSKYVMAKK